MGSEGEKDNESGQSRSEFGPPLGGRPPVDDFGPPVDDFGPPVGDFGAPVNDFGAPVNDFGPPVEEFGGPPLDQTGPRWTVQPAPDQPDLGWRPASETSTPPSTPTYRAPETPAHPQPQAPADFGPEVGAEPSSAATTRYQTPAAATPVAPSAEREQWWTTPATEYNLDDDDEPATSSRASGMSWADDPIAQRLAPGAPVAKPPASSSKGRWIALGLAGALAVVIGLVATIIALNRNPGGADDGKVTAAPPPTTTAALSCPASTDGKVTVGNGAGNTTSGPGAILGFQYAFYVERSGEKVRGFVAPDAENISTADIIQKAINEQIPFGTTHCLRITEVHPDAFDVDLTEHRPDGTTTVYRQTVITANRDGKILWFAIKERP
ncbi:hypothetical protein [Nocardia sp. XZ_19_385]|uniref:hypothetical protein n=1 Tax=Nocardia sp. XZ_19_385 TaxID=2769488 RepID=UPI001E334E15|nr:hypothetical protein [Nocardia sp. XZ_19_385]